jgi:hypothetical protein
LCCRLIPGIVLLLGGAILSAQARAAPLECRISHKVQCDQTGCVDRPTAIINRVDLDAGTLSRCDSKGCDTHQVRMERSGIFLNLVMPGAAFARIEFPSGNYGGGDAWPIRDREPRTVPMIRRMIIAAALILWALPSHATIIIYTCTIEGMRGPLVITIYDDGTPARIGVASGVGDMATIHVDRRSGVIVAVETNIDGIPITMTTINRDGKAIHSRQLIDRDGWFAPSQSSGTCT